MDPCLPGHFARGVHVFQASSRRLPGKHNGFDNVNNVVWKTAADIAVERRQRIGGAHKCTAAFTCQVRQCTGKVDGRPSHAGRGSVTSLGGDAHREWMVAKLYTLQVFTKF